MNRLNKLEKLLNELIESLTVEEICLSEVVGFDSQVDDLTRSLNALIKTNQGKFKSPKQAEFLYKKLKGLRDAHLEQGWAKKWIKNDSVFAFGYVKKLKQFGRTDLSKIRYAGRVYVIDGGGVIVAAKAHVEHPKGGQQGFFKIIGGKDIVFERKGHVPMLYDAIQAGRDKLARAKQNEPLIKKIEAVPGYEDNDFLQDMVFNLLAGRKLTPGQMRVVDKFVPVEMEEQDEFKQLYAEGVKRLDDIFRIYIAELKAIEKIKSDEKDKDLIKLDAQETRDSWMQWKKKSKKHSEMSETSRLHLLLHHLGWDSRGPAWSLTFLMALGIVANKGTKAPKWATQYLRFGAKFVSWLKTVQSSDVREFAREVWT